MEKIKIKKLTKSRIYLYTTLSVLLIITAYTLSTMDFGGVNIIEATRHFFKDLKTMFFSPSLSDRYTYAQVFQSLAVTISLAVLTTIIGSFIALFLSFFAAQNLSNKHLSKTIKLGLSFIRAIPTILWVMVFSVVANVGVEAAIIGMTFHSIAYLVKAYSESIEEIDSGIIEALRATGASFWKIIFHFILDFYPFWNKLYKCSFSWSCRWSWWNWIRYVYVWNNVFWYTWNWNICILNIWCSNYIGIYFIFIEKKIFEKLKFLLYK